MKKLFFTVLLAASLFGAKLQYEEFDGFLNPESIFVSNDYVYVSNVGKKLEPLTKDKDGFISKLDKNGNILEYKFLTDMNAPKGMMIVGNTLFVADIDILRGFDLKTKEQVFKLPIKGAVFLNDIEKINENTLFLSDTGTGLIHKIDIKNKTYTDFYKFDIKKFGGPNGLTFDNSKNILYVAGYNPDGTSGGVVSSLNINDKSINIINDKKESYDGIALHNGSLFISSWGHNLAGYVYEIKNGKTFLLPLPNIQGPADFFIDDSFMWIPKMVEGKILKVKLD